MALAIQTLYDNINDNAIWIVIKVIFHYLVLDEAV